jgi:hypothetical protein
MSDLPEPLSPPDCDLRGYEYMPLFGQKLFGSAFYTLALTNPRAGLAGQKLWWEAWQQRPAGSLPADDATLCRMADFGTDMKAWLKAKDIALHGFILCSDGRLYHALLSEAAILAHKRRLRDRTRKARWRADQDEGHDADVPRDTTRKSASRPGVEERRGEDRRGKEEETPLGPPSKGGRRRRGEPRFSNGFAQIAHELANGGSLNWLPPEDADGTPH